MVVFRRGEPISTTTMRLRAAQISWTPQSAWLSVAASSDTGTTSSMPQLYMPLRESRRVHFSYSPGSRYFIPPNRHLNGSSARSKPLAIPSGQTQDRFTRINVTETPAPELGDKALILRIIASFSGPPSIDIVTVSLRWRRGPIVAAVQVDTVNSKAYTSAVLQLALGMDSRINGVLTGAE